MKGIISALVIPFTDNQVNWEGLASVIDYNINVSKVDGLYINGSTGENFTMDTQMKKDIFTFVAKHNQGRVPLIAQIGSINLEEAIDLGLHVKSLNAYSALSAITPFYYKFSFEEIKGYYQSIVNAVNMDLIIYNIPLLTGVSMTYEQFEELFAIDHVVGIKFTTSDFYTMQQLRVNYPDKLIYSGFDEMLINAAVLGIDGAIGSTYNYQAFLAKDILLALKSGNLDLANEKQKVMNETINILLKNGLYQTIKAVLTADGCQGGECRAPFSKTNLQQREAAKQILSIIK